MSLVVLFKEKGREDYQGEPLTPYRLDYTKRSLKRDTDAAGMSDRVCRCVSIYARIVLSLELSGYSRVLFGWQKKEEETKKIWRKGVDSTRCRGTGPLPVACNSDELDHDLTRLPSNSPKNNLTIRTYRRLLTGNTRLFDSKRLFYLLFLF